MTQYRIVCTEQQPASNPPTHAHIVAVGIGNTPNYFTQRMSLSEVLRHIDQGDTFYTKGKIYGKVALVESYYCNRCNKRHIRSKADSTTDNNLDSLPRCNS